MKVIAPELQEILVQTLITRRSRLMQEVRDLSAQIGALSQAPDAPGMAPQQSGQPRPQQPPGPPVPPPPADAPPPLEVVLQQRDKGDDEGRAAG